MQRLTQYAWSLLLFIGAILAPSITTMIILLLLGSATVTLAIIRERKLQHLMQELSDMLPYARSHQSPALERSLHYVRLRQLVLLAIAEGILFVTHLLSDLDITTVRNYALLIVVALAPLGLEMELAGLLRSKHHRTSETVRTAIGYAVEDAWALLAIIGLSLVGSVWLHIPAALSALQIVFITCVARPLLSGRALQAMLHKVERSSRVLLISVVVYGSYILFFIRHYLTPQYTDSTNPISWQATTVAMVTFIACQSLLIILNPRAPKVNYYRAGVLLVALLVVVYVPLSQQLFTTRGPAAADWAWSIIGGLFYVALYLLQQASKQHSRQTVIAMHK